MASNSNLRPLESDKVFFPNLNGIRFIAALLVIIQHTEETKIKIGIPTSYRNDGALGPLGVSIFFVLSGFLITYLLQSEKLSSSTISLRNFYTRRMLRIWPLYYLIIFLGFWLIPFFIPGLMDEVSRRNLSENFGSQLLLNLLFLPNVAIILIPPITFVRNIWSVGVEEQFYLIWPILMRHFTNLLIPFIAVIIFFLGINFTLFSTYIYLLRNDNVNPDLLKALYSMMQFIAITRMDCMAVGGIGAWILFNKKTVILNIVYSKPVQIISYLLLITLIIKGVDFSFLGHFPYSILFIIIILNLASNKQSIISLNNRVFNYLGKISYGIYMFHQITLAISVNLLISYYVPYMDVRPSYVQLFSANIVLYSLVLSTVTAVSTISYYYFEKYFLDKKLSFSTIISGDNVGK